MENNMLIGKGFVRKDGRKGIRNLVVVVYLVQCATHVAKKIAGDFGDEVHLIGFTGCYPNGHANRLLARICTHPNVGGVVIVALGCESFPRNDLLDTVTKSGRPARLLVIQDSGGTAETVKKGQTAVASILKEIKEVPQEPMHVNELVVGTICGGSDATSGISANPAVGLFFDRFIDQGGTGIFEETGELIGCASVLQERSVSPEVGKEVLASIEKAARYYSTMGHGSFAPGNAEGGLTTQEEKSMGAYAKSGSCTINGLIRPGQIPTGRGLFLMDVVPDGEPRFGFPNINDVTEIIDMASSGCHLMLFTTGRGSVAGSATIPTIKICANPETYRKLSGDMDVDAGRILEDRGTLQDVGDEIYELVAKVAGGQKSKAEALGHQEFELPYKSFTIEEPPFKPHCL
jgi:altronate dehydratase large subunit